MKIPKIAAVMALLVESLSTLEVGPK